MAPKTINYIEKLIVKLLTWFEQHPSHSTICSSNATNGKFKTAKNWDKAKYDAESRKCLGLPDDVSNS
ncbi:hypothetical protein CAL7716_058910 [Calothrix sp. PCC 7716]|nr:hypothetical protein CAL7716_058910 [Calothrix sp. PCC 7716]